MTLPHPERPRTRPTERLTRSDARHTTNKALDTDLTFVDHRRRILATPCPIRPARPGGRESRPPSRGIPLPEPPTSYIPVRRPLVQPGGSSSRLNSEDQSPGTPAIRGEPRTPCELGLCSYATRDHPHRGGRPTVLRGGIP